MYLRSGSMEVHKLMFSNVGMHEKEASISPYFSSIFFFPLLNLIHPKQCNLPMAGVGFFWNVVF